MDWNSWYKSLTKRDKQKVLKAAELDLILDCKYILSMSPNAAIAFVLFFILLAGSILVNIYFSFYVCLKGLVLYFEKGEVKNEILRARTVFKKKNSKKANR